MKTFFFVISIGHHRTGEIVGKCTGVVFATDIEEAKQIAWEKHGGDNCCGLDVWEVDESGTNYTVWKGNF